MSSIQTIVKSPEKNLEPSSSLMTQRRPNNIFNLKIPNIDSLITKSSGLVSGLIGLAGNFWDKSKLNNDPPVHADNDYKDSEYSSSIVYEESPDILILNKNKVHGRKETFSREFGVNLKRARMERFSEYIPRRNMQLQLEEDVQPKITTVRESMIEKRNRTESCYPRLQLHRSLNLEVPTLPSIESSALKPALESNRELNSYDNRSNELEIVLDEHFEGLKTIAKQEDISSFERKLSIELNSLQVLDKNQEDYRLNSEKSLHEEENSGKYSENEQISHENSGFIKSRSLSSASVAIDGKIFGCFNKAQLCGIPALTFLEYIERLRTYEFEIDGAWHTSIFRNGLCCYKIKKLSANEQKEFEQMIAMKLMEFDPTNDMHLILLLGAYTSITGESDWPSKDPEWLNMGFSSPILLKELENGGVIGLLFAFYLSSYFPKFLKEMLEVSCYYSFDVFPICKCFSVDTIEILRSQRLHNSMNRTDKPLDILFLFYTGMLIQWFSIIVKNKDFALVYKKLLSEARSNPERFIELARKKLET